MATQLINIPFSKTDGVHTLHDALNLTQTEIDALGDDGIEAMKQERFDNWVTFITTPAPDPEPEETVE